MASCNITKKFIAELIGTFFLVFFGTGSAVVTLLIDDGVDHGAAGIGLLGGLGDWLAIGLAFGLTVMACIYVFGKISGAHLNPAVTIGLLISKNISLIDSVYYIVAQVIGAVLGSLLLFVCLGAPAVTIGGLGATAPGLSVGYIPAMIAECIGTFFLMLVVMGVAVDKKADPGVAGISIGMTVAAVIIVLGAFTGASINPARTFGP
jgi:glycerol uptake facilitator protein